MYLKNKQTGNAWLIGIIALGVLVSLGILVNYGLKGTANNNEAVKSQSSMAADVDNAMTADEKGGIAIDNKDAIMEDKEDGEMKDDTGTMMPPAPGDMIEKNDGTSGDGGLMAEDDVSVSGGAGDYLVYTAANYAAAEGDKRVLFFHAAWCPFCQEADRDFNANLEKIPAGVTLLKTDYDNAKDLKKKYGVTYQHTFVQVDASGNAVTKWNGGGINELIARLK